MVLSLTSSVLCQYFLVLSPQTFFELFFSVHISVCSSIFIVLFLIVCFFFFTKKFIPSNSEIPQMSFLIRNSLLIHGDIPRSLSSLLPVLQFYVQISSGNLQIYSSKIALLFEPLLHYPHLNTFL